LKGLPYLIEAVKELHDVKLRIVGEIDDNDNENVEFVGVKQGKDLVEEMQKATLLALPSIAPMESFGMVLIEAMACQTPVVGTNMGGIPEVIENGTDGFIVPAKDSRALAQAISKIVADKKLATRMGQQGEIKVREKFTWDTRAQLTREVFDACLTPRQAAPRIVQVTSYYPPHLGGMENVTAQIAEGFADKGYAVSVYTSDIGYEHNAAQSAKVDVHYLKSVEFAHTPIIFSLFFRLLALPRHSLIHLHVAQAFAPEMVYLVSRLRGIPYIPHIHLDVDPSGPLGFLLATYKKIFLKRVLHAAAKIICLSEPQKKLIAAKYGLPLESIVVIPNGVAEHYFIGKKTGANAVPHLLFVGRLAAQKNLLMLIEAVRQMQTSVLLDIVGEGEERENIEALVQKYDLTNVKLHGKKTGQALIELYRAANIFVLPSLKEGISLSMLEALAAGLPVVASDAPELRPILGECGVLVQNPTATNYAKALDAVLSDKDTLQRLGALAVQKARAYSWANVLDAIEDVYKRIKS
jgi:glycosyltransferase involved in cell wall biosynthesis